MNLEGSEDDPWAVRRVCSIAFRELQWSSFLASEGRLCFLRRLQGL